MSKLQKIWTLVLVVLTIGMIAGWAHVIHTKNNMKPIIQTVTKTEIQVEQPAVIEQNFDHETAVVNKEYPEDCRTTKRMAQAHAMAEMARELRFSEDSAVIQEAKAIWAQEKQNLDILAKTISVEAPGCPYVHQLTVGCVVLNRVKSSKFPNTIYDVIVQPGQFNKKYASNFEGVSDEFYAVAKACLDGEYSIPENVLYQANHKNGTGVWWTSHVKTPYWESYTYFCYG